MSHMVNAGSGWLGLDRVGSARLHFWLQLPDFRLVVVDRDLFNPHSPYGARHLLPLIYITIYK